MTNEKSVLQNALEKKASTHSNEAGVRAEMEAGGEEVKFNARIPKGLRDAFREVCKEEGRSMSWVVREWMRQAVRAGETGV